MSLNLGEVPHDNEPRPRFAIERQAPSGEGSPYRHRELCVRFVDRETATAALALLGAQAPPGVTYALVELRVYPVGPRR